MENVRDHSKPDPCLPSPKCPSHTIIIITITIIMSKRLVLIGFVTITCDLGRKKMSRKNCFRAMREKEGFPFFVWLEFPSQLS